jgi:hypothetical protein
MDILCDYIHLQKLELPYNEITGKVVACAPETPLFCWRDLFMDAQSARRATIDVRATKGQIFLNIGHPLYFQ